MSERARPGGVAVYAELLRIPHAARFAVFGVVAQVPFPMLSIGLLIGVRHTFGSYALAGAVAAVQSLTSAVSGPLVGRFVDAHGQRRVALPVSLLWLSAMIAMSACLAWRAPLWVVLPVAALLGVNAPYGSMMRGRWALVLHDRPERLNPALSLGSILEEFMWVVGTPVATLLATGVSPLAPLDVAIVAILLGMGGFLGDATYEPPASGMRGRMRAGRGARGVRGAAADGAGRDADPSGGSAREGASGEGASGDTAAPGTRPRLLTPALVLLMAIIGSYGAFQSTNTLAVVAFAEELGEQGVSGFALACFSGASMISALAYGAHHWTSPLWVRFHVGLVALGIGCSALLFVPSMGWAAVVLFIAGLAQAPTLVNLNEMLIRMVPRARLTEGMAFLGAMWVVGQSSSNFVGGHLVDALGSRGGFLTIVGFAVVSLTLATVAAPVLRRAIGEE